MDMTPMQVVVIAALGLTGAVGLLLRRLRRSRLRELEPVQEMPSPRERLSAELRDAPRQQARRAIEDHPLDSAPPLPERFVVEPQSFVGVASSAEPATLEHARLRCAELELLVREKDDGYRHAQALAQRADSASRSQQAAERKVRELELALVEHTEWFSQKRAELVSLSKDAQERAMAAERELALVREENARHVETLRMQQVDMRALQASIGDMEQAQRSLVDAELALATASEQHKALEQAAKSDIKAAIVREQNAREKVRLLEEQARQNALTEAHASAAVEHALAFEAEASALSQQVDELRRALEERDQRIAKLKVEEDASRMSNGQTDVGDLLNRELESSRASVEQLRAALDAAQERVERAGETDLELRRLRSEIAALDARQARPRTDAGTTPVTDTNTDAASKVPVARKRLFDTPAERDDLKMIKGIGPVMEQVLNDLGVTTFEQITAFTEDDVARVTEAINTFPGRIERDDWIGGARKAFEEKHGMSVDT